MRKGPVSNYTVQEEEELRGSKLKFQERAPAQGEVQGIILVEKGVKRKERAEKR